jgi:hypothetical protein
MTHPALGPSSDFGWATCHGCEKDSDRWGDPSEKHRDGCHGSCTRVGCAYHRVTRDPLLRVSDGIVDLLDTYHEVMKHDDLTDDYCEICDILQDTFHRALLGEPQ